MKILIDDAQFNAIINKLHIALQSNTPELAGVNDQLMEKFHLPANAARSLIYQAVLQLNKKLFPPINHLEIFHTEACNLMCTYCFEENMHSTRNIDPSIAKAAVDLLFDYSQDETNLSILHFGGEPTLNFPSIQYVTEYAHAKASSLGKDLQFSMTSNGVLITEEMAQYFAKYKIMVLLSVDGLESSHDRFRVDKHGHGTFEEVMKALAMLKKTQTWIGVKMTVMPQNVSDLVDDVFGLYQRGVNQFLISPAAGIVWSREDMKAFGEQYAKLYHWYKENKNGDLKITEFDEKDKKDGNTYFGCQAGRNSIAVSVTGELSPCSKMLSANRSDILAKLGDVNYGITHIRNRYELVKCLRLRSCCAEKEIFKGYDGGCYAANYEENHDIFVPSMEDVIFKKIIKNACLHS